MPIANELAIPEHLTFSLISSIENNERVPVLVLSALQGGGCDSVSELETIKSLNGNTLIVDIKGYRIIKNPKKMKICPSVMLESNAKISLGVDWLKQDGEKEIIFRLGAENSKYKISYSKYRMRLDTVQATSVVPVLGGAHLNTSVSLGMNLFPLDVAVIYLAVPISSQKEYGIAMQNFAKLNGFLPAEQVYPGIEQNKKSQFYVVLRNRLMPELNRPELIGKLPGENISVYIGQVDSSPALFKY